MEFELPGQSRGPECGRIRPLAIRLRQRLEPLIQAISHTRVRKLTVILRIDGSLGSFGTSGVENIKLRKGDLWCDLVIADHNWAQLRDDQIALLLAAKVRDAVRNCFNKYSIPFDEAELSEATNGEQLIVEPQPQI